jgi:glutathione S-transferase
VITIYQFPTAFDLPVSVSPYCAKLEAYLRATGRDYRLATGDVRKSPNKAVPYVAWGDGRITADSEAIIAELENNDSALDRGLSAADVELAAELRKHAEGAVYYACLYSRFVEDAGWKHQRATVREIVPALIAPILVPIIRRSQVKKCAENGFSSRDDYGQAVKAVHAIRDALGDKPFLLGEELRTVDCAVWGQLLHAAYTKSENPIRHAVRMEPTLMDYLARVANKVGFELPVYA